ncbi:concanavalin A-like lectin/glucanase domain-containing protein [Trametes gibbosa]|nr:concanavalin A-like lectin/glucanase domain-containing protein [Trametes gibbosa]
MRCATISFASALLTASPAFAGYNLVKEYSGAYFFSGWDFYGAFDNLTNGESLKAERNSDVNWVDQANATQSRLAYVNDAGHAVIKVDDTSFVPYNYKRDSVRVTTQDYFPVGTVVVFDATHLPFGCSVWPGFWMKGVDWPTGGEVDIFEGVNMMTQNQMALHTQPGCVISSSAKQTGRVNVTDCSSGTGYTILETQEDSYGSAFASAGGGVWATQIETSGINIWFWTRKNVPASVTNAGKTIDPSSWGTPSAAFSSSSCDINKFFGPQQVVIDITLCGDWAGVPSEYQATCGGDGSQSTCYVDNVINNGTNYNNAFFEISSIKAFTTDSSVLIATVSGGSTVLATATAGVDSSTANEAINSLPGIVGTFVASVLVALSWTML